MNEKTMGRGNNVIVCLCPWLKGYKVKPSIRGAEDQNQRANRLLGGKTQRQTGKQNRRRMHPVLLLVAAAVVGVVRGEHGHCWELPGCQELTSEISMMECIQLCQSDLHELAIVLDNVHFQPPTANPPSPLPSSPFSPLPQAKRSYSMEHFRWGKPLGRKRRPIRMHTGNSAEEESAELPPGEKRRRELSWETTAAEDEEKLAKEEVEQLSNDKDVPYKMKHFRWGGPLASKRYGGFMKSWSEHSQRPLITLFKNVINKEEQE